MPQENNPKKRQQETETDRASITEWGIIAVGFGALSLTAVRVLIQPLETIETDTFILLGIGVAGLAWTSIKKIALGSDGIELEKIQNKIEAAKEESEAAREGSDDVSQTLAELVRRLEKAAPVDADTSTEGNGLEPKREITVSNDPQHGRFGGQYRNNDRILTAKVSPSKVRDMYCRVRLCVESTNPQKPLEGDVRFFVHDTFKPDNFTKTAIGGRAELTLRAWGAFTVGVLADNGDTELELDLADRILVDAPSDWQQR